MKFEKAIEFLRTHKNCKIRRDAWDKDVYLSIAYSPNILLGDHPELMMLKEDNLHPDGFPASIFGYEVMADDWAIYAPYTVKVEDLKGIKHEIREFLKEEPTMYTDLEITFKSGETTTYTDSEWDDYSYDGKSVAVKKDGAWVGIYNFDNVFCVELKERNDD